MNQYTIKWEKHRCKLAQYVSNLIVFVMVSSLHISIKYWYTYWVHIRPPVLTIHPQWMICYWVQNWSCFYNPLSVADQIAMYKFNKHKYFVPCICGNASNNAYAIYLTAEIEEQF